ARNAGRIAAPGSVRSARPVGCPSGVACLASRGLRLRRCKRRWKSRPAPGAADAVANLVNRRGLHPQSGPHRAAERKRQNHHADCHLRRDRQTETAWLARCRRSQSPTPTEGIYRLRWVEFEIDTDKRYAVVLRIAVSLEV